MELEVCGLKYRLLAVVATGLKVRVCETLAFTAESTVKW